jgi:zinc transporter ZupT
MTGSQGSSLSYGDVQTALWLTCLGACGTALGGLLVVAHPSGMDFRRLGLLQVGLAFHMRCVCVCVCLKVGSPSVRQVGPPLRPIQPGCFLTLLQGLAGGLMFSISFVDLLPAAIEEEGFAVANLWFYSGVAFFAAVVAFIPEPDLGGGGYSPAAAAIETLGTADSAASGGGASAAVPPSTSYGGEVDRPINADAAPSVGRGAGCATEPAVTEPGANLLSELKRERRKVLMSGIITAVGIALHNFPEGIAVFLVPTPPPFGPPGIWQRTSLLAPCGAAQTPNVSEAIVYFLLGTWVRRLPCCAPSAVLN